MEMYMDYSREPHLDILCIDVKSFYASVECVARGLNPMQTMLVVMSNAENAGGLTLSASPMAKKVLGISNVSRRFEIPDHPKLLVVPPRMSLYIKKNLEILDIFREFASDEDILVYSIDEAFLKVDAVKKLYQETAYQLARHIQRKIYHKLGLYTTVGIGDNMLLAKLALDNEAKFATDFKAEWRYADVKKKVWKIRPITDFWGINKRTAKRLDYLGIDSIYDLAHSDPHVLKREFGVIGLQYYAHAWGIDRSDIQKRHHPKEKTIGLSQILPKDYHTKREIEIVLQEMSEQLTTRLRAQGLQTSCVSLGIGTAYHEISGGFHRQMSIDTTNQTKKIVHAIIELFNRYYQGEGIRSISVSCSKLTSSNVTQLTIFEDPKNSLKAQQLDQTIDSLRARFGFTSLLHAHSLMEGATSIQRSKLVGGHLAGEEVKEDDTKSV